MKDYYDIPQQVQWYDAENERRCGGIVYKDEIICACCGGIFPKDEWDDLEKLHDFNTWIDFTEFIIDEDEMQR